VGGEVTNYNVRLPVEPAALRRNVEAALARGLPELTEPLGARQHRLRVVATGPSARLPEFRYALSGVMPSLAVNGALDLFDGVAPEFWAACDPQAKVADFLRDPPHGTTYLVASHCDPAVFDALRGRRVLVWHLLSDAYRDLLGDRACVYQLATITLCSLFGLGDLLGFSRYETFGWDGCFFGAAHHANDQAPPTDPILLNEVGEARFATTTSWLYEAEIAENAFITWPRDVRVNGPGFFGAVLRGRGHVRTPARAA
jgi:hypothetical protein